MISNDHGTVAPVGLEPQHAQSPLQLSNLKVQIEDLKTVELESGSDVAEGEPRATVMPSKKPFSFYMSILMLGLMCILVSWDSTSLAVAIPVIARELQGSTIQSFWAGISFTLGVVVSLPVYSSVSDILGRKPPLYFALTLFAIGSIVFALAKEMSTLIVGRTLQGLGGGGIDMLEAIILADITTLKERPLYMGLMAIAIATASVVGPIGGALFAEYLDWRWIGWINLPFIGVIFVLAYFFLHLRHIGMSFSANKQRLDGVGMLLFPVGAALVALPLSWAGALYPWSSWRTILPLAIGLVVLVIFAFYERNPVEPIIPYRIFDNITIISALLSGAINGVVLYSFLQYLPLFYQAVFLKTPIEASISLLPLACFFVAFTILSAVTLGWTHGYRLQLWAGWILMTVFIGVWWVVGTGTSHAELYIFQIFLGIGLGTIFTATSIAVQASTSKVDDQGLAAGMLVFLRLSGALVGLAVCSTVFSSFFKLNITSLGVLPEQLIILEDPSQAIAFIPMLRTLDLPDETIHTLIEAYRKPFQAISIIMACFSGIGFILSLFIKELSLEKEDVGRQGFEQPN